MKIALIGYGKMGHMIEMIARKRGHEIVCIIDKDNEADFASDKFKQAEVAIEFSAPMAAEMNIRKAWEAGVAVVCGTTGWNVKGLREEMMEEADCCQKTKTTQGHTLLWSSNFSVGVNLFFALNKRLAGLMAGYKSYTPTMSETHHIHKLDAPSGTAKTLAQDIEAVWGAQVPIESIREGEVPGIHTVVWDSNEDTITISHSAKSREGFALGAVIAAEWLAGKEGWHSMDEVFA